MATNLLQLLNEVQDDPWRKEVGFSKEIDAANSVLFSNAEEAEKIKALNAWIAEHEHQPCVFGKIAAKLGLISYCLLTEEDLAKDDEFVQDKIQAARTNWTADGHFGDKSAFIVVLISKRIAVGKPDDAVKQLAHAFCSHYLIETEVKFDEVHHDEIFLTKAGRDDVVWKWLCGVNYFCTQGDGRWWQDHRIPGGMAFSVNSVGHMVKSAQLKGAMQNLEAVLGAPKEEWGASNLNSLGNALVFAMRTIGNASEAVSGKATELVGLPKDASTLLKCPVELPPALKDRNHCQYSGFYHTDVTLPSIYFLPDIERPGNIAPYPLDFTYLFHKHVSNPAHLTMAEGRRVRASGEGSAGAETTIAKHKTFKASESTVRLADQKRLLHALTVRDRINKQSG